MALLSVPLAVKEEVYGALTLYYDEAREFGDEELALAAAFADQAALAMENARLHAEAERRLHDIEALYRADESLHRSLRLEGVLQALVDEAATMLQAEKTSVLIWDSDHARLAVRAAHGFRPELFGRMSFVQGEGISARVAATGEVIAIQDVLADPRVPPHINARINSEATAGRTRLEITATLEGAVQRLSPTVQVGLYCIAQEALNNVVKHAHARHAAVMLRFYTNGDVHLQVQDDGLGFDATAIPSGHLGVSIMRERARAIPARLRITSHSGSGTLIDVHWSPSEDPTSEF